MIFWFMCTKMAIAESGILTSLEVMTIRQFIGHQINMNQICQYVVSVGSMLMLLHNGKGKDFQPKPNGKKPREETLNTDFPGEILTKKEEEVSFALEKLEKTAMAKVNTVYMTFSGTSGNGWLIGTTPIIMKRVLS